VRILVDGAALATGPARLRMAVAGLARRGHAIAWLGAAPRDLDAPDLRRVAGLTHAARSAEDVVIGTERSVVRTALAGAAARARAMILSIDPARAARWTPWQRWAFGLVHSAGLIEPEAEGSARATLPASTLERLALWPDGPPAGTADPGHPDVEVLERACERALARHRGAVGRHAAFLDRDGTLIAEREYLDDPGALELLPGVPEALRMLRAAGFALVVISNQSGVGRGYFTLARAHEIMARLRILLRSHGVELDAIYLCPHRPDEGCACRKPATGLIERAAEDLLLAPARSVMIGDKCLDVETGQRAGGFGVLVRTGYGGSEPGVEAALSEARPPDHVADDLRAAAAWIVARAEAASG
jgi:histidinol-phosphate phosphatase family protein